jgi:hypothetical protein
VSVCVIASDPRSHLNFKNHRAGGFCFFNVSPYVFDQSLPCMFSSFVLTSGVFRSMLVAMFTAGLWGCAGQQMTVVDEAVQSQPIQEDWQILTKAQLMRLPTKSATSYKIVQRAGRKAILAQSDRSASMYRYFLESEQREAGKLRFSWKSDHLIDQADMAERDSEDAVVRVILSFEGDRAKFSNKNRMLSDLSHALTGEEMPYATLMYVWCNKRPAGSVIINPRTDRIRKLVVESGKGNLGKWLDYERDIRADFIQAFGEEPGALTGIALMTDTDNTQSKATAWYGPISLKPSVKTAAASSKP